MPNLCNFKDKILLQFQKYKNVLEIHTNQFKTKKS